MELRTLRSFLVVTREGSITRAAQQLHITQPALSRQLFELEREMGCELLLREHRGVSLTEEGMLLRKRAIEIVDLADRAERELRSLTATVQGDVWVGGRESRAMSIVAQAASLICKEHPEVRLRVHPGYDIDVMERLDKGLLDFGIVCGSAPQNRHYALRLPHEDRWGVLMRQDHPLAKKQSLTIDDLRHERLIVSDDGSGQGEVGDCPLRQVGLEDPDVVATYALSCHGALLVEAGVGIAICLDGIVPAGKGTPFAYAPIEGTPTMPTFLVWKRQQSHSRACDLFLRTMCELAKGGIAKGV